MSCWRRLGTALLICEGPARGSGDGPVSEVAEDLAVADEGGAKRNKDAGSLLAGSSSTLGTSCSHTGGLSLAFD